MTAKRRSSFPLDQLVFSFDAPKPAREEADLAGLGRIVAAAVARILREDSRSRQEIAGAMSALLDEEVSPQMLDGYASEARETVNVSAHRLLALIAATDRFDVLDRLVRKIGAALLVGDEIMTAELGHIDRQMAELSARKRRLQSEARPIGALFDPTKRGE